MSRSRRRKIKRNIYIFNNVLKEKLKILVAFTISINSLTTREAYLVSLNGESQQGEDADADGEGGGEGVDAAVN